MCIIGVFGIILMIIENEFTFNRVDHKDTTFSLLLKSTITFTTIILVGLVFYYHRIDLSLYCVDNSIDDWRIILTRKKIVSILFEAFICLIHPIPGHFLIEWSSQYVKKIGANSDYVNPYRTSSDSITTIASSNITTMSMTTEIPEHNQLSQAFVPIDVMLSLPSKILNFIFL